MHGTDAVLALVALAVAARMALSLRRMARGVGAARRELEVWRAHHPRPHR